MGNKATSMKNERKCAFSFVSDNYYYPVGCHKMINSFKRFHPEIDLIIFRQKDVDKVFKEKGLNFYNAKPTFAKLLTDKYDLIADIDADSVICGRLTEVFDKDNYDVGSVLNLNDYENTSVDNVTEDMYLNAGLIASRNPKFWDIWEEANKQAMEYKCKENDIMNLVIYNNPIVKRMRLKIFDKDNDYYGCKSLNREPEFYIEKDELFCRGEKVKIYHHAKGGGALPKLQYEEMSFTPSVVDWLNKVSREGYTTEVYASL